MVELARTVNLSFCLKENACLLAPSRPIKIIKFLFVRIALKGIILLKILIIKIIMFFNNKKIFFS